MTLAVAWERKTHVGTELVFAADSRVRQGGEWDACPKIFRLPRPDAMLALAGDTMWAYPIVLQTIAAIEGYRPSRTSQYDLRDMRGHMMRTIDGMMATGTSATGGLHEIGFEFLLGGWCWQEQSFLLWRLYWSRSDNCMRHDTVKRQLRSKFRFIGDRDTTWGEEPESDLVGRAKALLSEVRREHHGLAGLGRPLDMEPWEVLVRLLREGCHDTIGGPPQLGKVYRSMTSLVFAVPWPDRESRLTLLGRRLLEYERIDTPVVMTARR